MISRLPKYDCRFKNVKYAENTLILLGIMCHSAARVLFYSPTEFQKSIQLNYKINPKISAYTSTFDF